jgi:predicted aspartyl protease
MIAELDSSHHAHLFGLINCSQFAQPKPIHFIVDTGSSNTTLLSDDVTRLALDCSRLQLSPIPCLTARGTINPYLLPSVELTLATFQGWFNRTFSLTTFVLRSISCMPPTHPQLLTQQRIMQSCSLLGMDMLSLFRKWRFTDRTLVLDT